MARLVPVTDRPSPLPDLDEFRATLQAEGPPLSRGVVEQREAERS